MMKKITRKSLVNLCLRLFLLLALSPESGATDYIWTGNSPANTASWNDAANWTPIGIPGAADNATINSGNVNISSNTSIATLIINGGNLTGTGGLTVISNLVLSSGSLICSGDIDISGDFNWNGGALGDGVVGGNVTVSGETNISSSDNHSISKKTLILNGNANWTDGNILINNNGVLRNAAGSTMTESAGTIGITLFTSGTGYFENDGTFIRNGTGTLTITRNLTNTGAIQVNNGTLKFQNTNTHSNTSSIAIAAGATLEFVAGSCTFNGTAITGDGTLKVNGGAVTASIGTTMSNTINGFLNGTFTDNAGFTWATMTISGGTYNGTSNVTVTGNVTQSGGVLANIGDFTIGGTYDWANGTIGDPTATGVVTVNGLATLSGTSHTIYKKTLVLNGNANWTSGFIHIDYNGILRNPAGATIMESVASNGLLSSGLSGTGYFENDGTFIRNGAGTLTITRHLTNTGAIQVNDGTLKLQNTSTHSNTSSVAIAAGTTLEFASGTCTFNGTAITGAGTLKTSGGATTANAGTTMSNTMTGLFANGTFTDNAGFTWASMTISGGTYKGTSNVTVTGTYDWTGGDIGDATASGVMMVNGLATISAGSNHSISSKTLVLNGNTNWTGGGILINNNGILRNAAGSTMTESVTSSTQITSFSSGTGYFENEGTFIRNGAGILTIDRNLTNTGVIQLNNGTLLLQSTSTFSNTSSIAIAAGATLEFNSGTCNFNGAAITGTGTFKMNGSAVTANAGTTMSNTMTGLFASGTFTDNVGFTWASMTMSGGHYNGTSNVIVTGNMTHSGGTLYNIGDLTIGGTYNWTGGSIGDGTASGVVTVNGLATISSSSNHTIAKKTLVLNGNTNWTGGSILINNNGILRNAAGSTMTESAGAVQITLLSSGIGYFENEGTFIRNGAGTLTITRNFTNTGSFQLNNGTLLLSGASTHSGTSSIALASGTTLEFSSNAHSLDGAAITGAATLKLTSGTVTANAGTTMSNTMIGIITSGTFTDNVGFTWASMTLSGSYNGTSNVTVTGNMIHSNGGVYNVGDFNIGGTYNWSGGNIGDGTASGVVTVNGLATLSGSNHPVYKKTLILNGNANWTGGNIYIDYNGILRNAAGKTMTESAGSVLMSSPLFGTGYFENEGTFIRNGSGTLTITRNFTNSGTLQLNSGVLFLNGTSSHTNTSAIAIANNATLEFGSGAHSINAVTITGTGLVKNSGGTITISGNVSFPYFTITGGSLIGTGNLAIVNDLNFNNGALSNTGDITIGGAFNWLGGSFGDGIVTGTVTVNGLTTLSSSNHAIYKKTLILNGNTNWTAGAILIDYNGLLRNTAGKTMTESAGTIQIWTTLAGTGYFENEGTLIRNGAGILTINRNFTNTGSVQLNNGTLLLSGVSTHSGTSSIALASGTTLEFSSNAHSLDGAAITGAATLKVTSGTVTVNAGTTISNTLTGLLTGGTFTDNAGLTWGSMTLSGGSYNGTSNVAVLGNMTLSGGTLSNTGDMNIGGTLSWTGGNMGISTSTGTTTVSGLTTISTAGNHQLSKKTLILNGGTNWTAGPILIDYNGILRNPAGQTMTETTSSGVMQNNFSTTGFFENQGTFLRNGTGNLTVTRDFTNTGLVQVNSGTLNINGNFTNAATGTLAGNSPGVYGFLSGPAFSNSGTISPGHTGTSTLKITRSTLPIKILNIDLAAPAQKDSLSVQGNLDLSGGSTLNVTENQCLNNGTYDIIAYTGTLTGTFATTNLPVGYTLVYNAAAKKIQVTYLDPPPTITCPAATTVNNTTGFCYATGANFGTPNAQDNCPGVLATNNAPTNIPVGVNTVTWTATDSKSQTASCTQSVTVVDVEPPVITCPANIAVNNDPGECSAVVTVPAASATDNCGVESITNDEIMTYPVGVTTVTHTATDIHGNSRTCEQTVTVTDNELPDITCPANIAVNNDPGECSAALTVPAASAADNCGIESITNNDIMTYPVGTTIVTHTATDIHGNTQTCEQTVTVADNELPDITCPENIAVNNDPGACSATLTVPAALAADNCAIESITNDGIMTYPVGTTTVTHTATDIHGNTRTCEQTVTVTDNELPDITCPANIAVNNDPGECSAALTVPAALAADNCGIESITNDEIMTYPVGTTTVTHTATDIHGNTRTCEQTVTVIDNELPDITCPANIAVNNDPGECSAIVTVLAALAADNCGIESITNNEIMTYPVGTTTITHTATDIHGNTQTCEQIVTVTDNELPDITCPANIVFYNNPGTCGWPMVAGLELATAADNCAIQNITNDGLPVYSVGTTTVIHTATDIHGNASTCSQTVTVIDNELPDITCPANIVVNNDPGECSAVVTVPAASAADNCGIESITNDEIMTYPVGVTTVTHTATDIHGNTKTCEQTVTVTDNELPDITCPANIAVNNDPGECSAALTVPAASAADNCGIESITNDEIMTYPVGTTTVTHTATDIHGNTNTCEQMVTVTDNELPAITCPATLTINLGLGGCTASTSLLPATATDNCLIQNISNNGLSAYLVGTTVIVHTATDNHGNTASCTQAVIVIPPAEICNGTDDDCDGLVDNDDNDVTGQNTYYADLDGDGYGAGTAFLSCPQPSGIVANNTDCNDNNAAINPGAVEICNFLDDDCDLSIDENGVNTFYADNDGDTYGGGAAILSCTQPVNTTTIHLDCDDTNAAIKPGAIELCNGVDDNCNSIVDDVAVCPKPTVGLVSSNISYSSATISWTALPCALSYEYSYRYQISPGVFSAYTAWLPTATNSANLTGLLSNTTHQWRIRAICSVPTPSAISTLKSFKTCIPHIYYADADADGYGDPANTVASCSTTPPAGYKANNTDCNDAAANVYPGAPEFCDGLDNDCDGLIAGDEGFTFYEDADADDYGNIASTSFACTLPAGYSSSPADCNDADNTIKPGAIELCDAIDNNCDGIVDNVTTCPKPVVSATTDITSTTAVIHWSEVACAVNGYQYRLRAKIGGVFTAYGPWIPVGTNSASLTGLLPGTIYQYQVRAICYGTNKFSQAAPGIVFTTLGSGLISTGSSPGTMAEILVKTGYDVSIFPNPTYGAFTVVMDAGYQGIPLELILTDGFGRLLKQYHLVLNKGANQQEIDLTELPDAVYYIELRTDKGIVHYPVVKAGE